MNDVLGRLADTAVNGSKQNLIDLEQAGGIIFEKEIVLLDASVRPYISFPSCIYWDWTRNWCSSGGAGKLHINQFVLVITATLGMEL